MHSWRDPEARYGLRLTLFAVALALVTMPFALLLAAARRDGLEWDVETGRAVYGFVRRHGALRTAATAVTTLGSPLVLYPVGIAATAYVLRRGRRRLALFVALTGLGGGALNTAVKLLVDRPRPVFGVPLATALGDSFPSGHTMGSTAVYGAVLLAFLPALPRGRRRAAVAAAVLLVLAVAASRVTLGVHYVSDVAAGLVLGLAWLCASTAAFRIWRTERGVPPAPVSEGAEPEAGPVLSGSA
jgi:undecaprenyl-diphosphatase